MPWQDETIPTLRVLVNDLDSTSYQYSDDRLAQTLVVAAKLINQEIDFDNDYIVSIENVTITPDPVDAGDEIYVNMMILKAACIIDHSTFRTKALIEGVKAALGPANLSVAGNLAGFKTLLEVGPCASFIELKEQIQWGNVNIVKAILSPFTGNKFDPRYLNNYRTNDCRDR